MPSGVTWLLLSLVDFLFGIYFQPGCDTSNTNSLIICSTVGGLLVLCAAHLSLLQYSYCVWSSHSNCTSCSSPQNVCYYKILQSGSWPAVCCLKLRPLNSQYMLVISVTLHTGGQIASSKSDVSSHVHPLQPPWPRLELVIRPSYPSLSQFFTPHNKLTVRHHSNVM